MRKTIFGFSFKVYILRLMFGILSIVCFSSCATMTRWFDSNEKNKRMYTVTINSKTRGLPVYYTDKQGEHLAGYTPCNIYSDKAKIQFITVKNGDIYQTVKLSTKPRTSIYWNIVPAYTWIYGYFVDLGTRRGITYKQKEYFVDL